MNMQKVLNLIIELSSSPRTAFELMAFQNCSIATLKRDIQQARHLGADIVSLRVDGQSVYHLENWRDIKKTVTKWSELNQTVDLRAS
jgi:hypothetical protein